MPSPRSRPSTASSIGWKWPSPPKSSAEPPQRGRELIVAAEGLLPEPIPGYAARILDGNVLTGTEHRITPLRTTNSAGLPGMSLGDLRAGQRTDPRCRARGGRPLSRTSVARCTWSSSPANSGSPTATSASARSCSGSSGSGAFFLIRWHSTTCPFEPVGPLRALRAVCDRGGLRAGDPRGRPRRRAAGSPPRGGSS